MMRATETVVITMLLTRLGPMADAVQAVEMFSKCSGQVKPRKPGVLFGSRSATEMSTRIGTMKIAATAISTSSRAKVRPV